MIDQFRKRGKINCDRFPACNLPANLFWGKIRDGSRADIQVGAPFFQVLPDRIKHPARGLDRHILHARQDIVVDNRDIGAEPYASSASSPPILPLERVVSTRTSSTGSRQAPLVTSTLFPASGLLRTARSQRRTISSISANFAFPSSILGPANPTPHDSRVLIFRTTAG